MAFEYYNTISSSYGELYHEEQRKKYDAIKEIVGDKHSNVLDVGCGTGLVFEYFSNVEGIEPSIKMIEQSKHSKNITQGFATNIHNIFEPNKFDLLLCVTTLHHIKDLATFNQGIRKVCKKNATLVFSILHSAKSTKKLTNFIQNTYKVKQEKIVLNDKIFFCDLKKFK